MLDWFRQPRTEVSALSLPPEIMLLIAERLDNVSVICLGLTCRGFYTLCFPKPPHLDTTEKEQLLLLLEKDVAGVYFCPICKKLHQWRAEWTAGVNGDLPCQQRTETESWSSVHFPYHIARLIMNRHLYGPAHGLHLSKIECRNHGLCSNHQVEVHETTQARIIDDKLLLMVTRTLSHTKGDSYMLRSHIDRAPGKICEHLTTGRGTGGNTFIQLPELEVDRTTTDRHFAICDRIYRHCNFCLTDYCIDISCPDKRQGFIIKITAYRELGKCRSPDDWRWRSISTRKTLKIPRIMSAGQTSGAVVERWNKPDKIENIKKQSKNSRELATLISVALKL